MFGMFVLISFEWQKKMEHLKIIKPHCQSIMLSLDFRYFQDMHEMLVATKREIVKSSRHFCYTVTFLEPRVFQFRSSGLSTVGCAGCFSFLHSYSNRYSIEHISVSAECFSLLHMAALFSPLDYCADQLCVHPHSLLLLSWISNLATFPVESCLVPQYSVVTFTQSTNYSLSCHASFSFTASMSLALIACLFSFTLICPT